MGRGEMMLGYTYQDIQEFGGALNWALHYIPESNTEAKQGILEIWNFFEGLLAEGYVDEPVN